MKPIENISKSMFKVNGTYRVLLDDYRDDQTITISTILPCTVPRCNYRGKGACEEIQFVDEDSTSWCGIPADFEEVEE